MKIAIDVSQVIYGTGVSTYTKKLTESLTKYDKKNEYLLFGGSLRRKAELSMYANKVFSYPPALADFVWNRMHMFPIENILGKIDLLHTSDWSEPPTRSATKVTTIHDLYPIKFPKLINKKVLDVHRRRLYWVFKESKLIIVPSVSTLNDLVELGINKSILRVVPEAPDLSKATESEINATKQKYNIKGQYVIAIGATRLKNTEKIIKAFHLAKSGKDLKLIIVGNRQGVRLSEERNVRALGHVNSDSLKGLLTGASALVFPSLYEGFGIPILNAFNCDVPVVTSSNASIPEVAGEAAVYVDPNDENSIAEGIIKAIRGPKGLIGKGREQVKKFSWEKTARMTLDVYREALR